jgi:hypothetical protein
MPLIKKKTKLNINALPSSYSTVVGANYLILFAKREGFLKK